MKKYLLIVLLFPFFTWADGVFLTTEEENIKKHHLEILELCKSRSLKREAWINGWIYTCNYGIKIRKDLQEYCHPSSKIKRSIKACKRNKESINKKVNKCNNPVKREAWINDWIDTCKKHIKREISELEALLNSIK